MAGEFLEQCTIQKFLEMKDREFEKEFRFYDNLDQRDISEKFQEYEKFLDPVVTFFIIFKLAVNVIKDFGKFDKLPGKSGLIVK